MVTKRGRQSPSVNDRDIEAFAARAERPAVPRPVQPNLPAWKIRNKEPKVTGTNFRFSESQSALLRAAAAEEDLSQQKILEQIVWPIIEERYGTERS